MGLWIGIAGCRKPVPAASSAPTYSIRGTVLQLEPAKSAVVLQHEAIPGLMPAMTMSYPLANPAELSELHKGDRIVATLLVHPAAGGGGDDMQLTDLDVVGQARPDEGVPAGSFHVPAIGETVPDFVLLNQSGERFHLRSLRGKVVALTFIYTRCPVADYCPRMSRNFAAMDAALAQDPKLYEATHLLSISFDPAYDTPKVLRSYGGAYTGRYTQETFQHWSFAAPGAADLDALRHWFAVGVTPVGSSTLQHTLVTVILGPDSRVLAFYPGNDWTVEQALGVMRAAALH